jgi:dihydrofolate reductase
MRRVIVSNQITIDGVIESPSPDSWYIAEGEHEESASLDQLLAADDLLLGRKTYEGLAAVWPEITDDRGFADRVNSLPKHVASRTLQEPLKWNATLIKGDLAEYVADLKQQAGGNILVYGGGEFAYHLVAEGLADEILFWVHPFVWGPGERPFQGKGPVRLWLTATTTFNSGVTLLRYRSTPD